jgi:uncharacterized protein
MSLFIPPKRKRRRQVHARLLRPVLVSIHDVMASNLDKITSILIFLESFAVHPMTLLVVPGTDWRPSQIAWLKKLQQNGIELAGHGWSHRLRAERIGSFGHRLHSALISRKEAEHLSLSPKAITELIQKSYRWFSEAGLTPPCLYVPPAWAMGGLSRYDLHALPYRYYESLIGVYDVRRERTRPMALCGYMGDTWPRALFLRTINAICRKSGPYPLRISIHPHDLELPLAGDLATLLNQCSRFQTYRSIR